MEFFKRERGEKEREALVEARRQRKAGERLQAASGLVLLLQADCAEEIKRDALMELALVAQDEGQLTRAIQILGQYLNRFPSQPGIIEALLRQGLLYRELGVSQMAISKLYAAMTSALALRLDQLDHYQNLVLQAQIEIAETYYQEGRWGEATEFLKRLLKLDSPHLDRSQVSFKLVRALNAQGRAPETVGQARSFLEQFPDSPEVPEVRFLLASMLKQQGRNAESLEQVLLLLQAEQVAGSRSPERWAYWQKRAGNEIANQLYREGDYLATLEIYQRLVELDSTAVWQFPVLYQIGLVYERLEQPARAAETYRKLVAREGEVAGEQGTLNLKAVLDMARWRLGNLSWFQNAMASSAELRHAGPAIESVAPDERSQGNR